MSNFADTLFIYAYMERQEKRIPGWARILIHIGCMAAVTAILLIFLFRWISSYTRHGQYISVPDITGMVEEEAAAALEACSLRYDISDFRYEADMQEGQVIEQRPKAGAGVKANHIIHLTVNTGRIPTIRVPDVADNSSLRAAESKLKSAGFKLTEPEFIAGEKDWVYEVRLKGRTVRDGEEIPEGSILTIVVGNGEDYMPEDSVIDIDTSFFK